MMENSSVEVQVADRADQETMFVTRSQDWLVSCGEPAAGAVCSATGSAIALPAPSANFGRTVAQLVVRNLPDDLVKALKQRAARNNRSAEQEHREILRSALRGPRRRTLADVLASMPNVGRDDDFARDQGGSRG